MRRPVLPAAGWAVIAGLLAVVGARARALGAIPLAIGVRGVERRILLAAYPVALLALLGRRRGLASAASALALVQLVSFVRARGGRLRRPIDEDVFRLRLVTANLLCTNTDVARLADEIADEDADVVLLQEVTPTVAAALRVSRLWSAYPQRRIVARPGFHGSATFSRLPVIGHVQLNLAGTPMLRTDLATPHGPMRVVNVHTVAPLTLGQARTWRFQLEMLGDLADADASPVILAGDFNATGDHRPFRRLLRRGLRDAFDVAGRGDGTTWPVGRRFLPRLLRLDHVLTSDDVEIAMLRAAPSAGSDHARLIAELGIRSPLPSEG